MKKCKVLCLFLCIVALCSPSHVAATEGFSWDMLSEQEPVKEEHDQNDKDNEKTEQDNTPANDEITWIIGTGGNETDIDDETGRNSDSDEEKPDIGESDSEAPDDKEKTDKQGTDSDSEDDESEKKETGEEADDDRTKYPSGNIYSEEETGEMISEKYRELRKAYEIEDKFRKTKEIDRIDSFILNFCGDPLKGKKIAFLGDSITAGNGGTLTPDGSGMNYTDFISKYTSAQIINLGIGGTPFDGNDNDDAIVYRYGDIPDDTDIIVLFGGINDLFAGSDHFGSLDDPQAGTYCGDIYKTFRQISKQYADADVYVVITYPNKMEDYKEYTGENWQKYANVQIELADEFGFHVIDLYKEGFLDSSDAKVRNAFFKDDIHPDDLGSEVLGRHILVHLIRNYL